MIDKNGFVSSEIFFIYFVLNLQKRM